MFIAAWISGCCQKVWNFIRGKTGMDSHTRVGGCSCLGGHLGGDGTNDFSVCAVLLLRTDLTGVSWQETAGGASSNIEETGRITLALLPEL